MESRAVIPQVRVAPTYAFILITGDHCKYDRVLHRQRQHIQVDDHYAPSVCVKLMVNTWPQVNPGSTQGLKLMGSCHRCTECLYDNWRPWEQASGVQSVYMMTPPDPGCTCHQFSLLIPNINIPPMPGSH